MSHIVLVPLVLCRQEQEDLELALRLQREEEDRAANVSIFVQH